jgi:hypothetical protein
MRLQNKAIRIVSGSNYNATAGPLYERLYLLTLSALYDYQMSKIMFIHITNELPEPLRMFFRTNKNVHEYHTRRASHPYIYIT